MTTYINIMDIYDSIHYEVDCYTKQQQELATRYTSTDKRAAIKIAQDMAAKYPYVEVNKQYTYEGDYIAGEMVRAYLNGKLISK